MAQLLSHAGLRRLFTNHQAQGAGDGDPSNDEEGLDDEYGGLRTRRKRRAALSKKDYPPVPNDEGRRLMTNGTFGAGDRLSAFRRNRKPRLARQVLDRELGQDIGYERGLGGRMSQRMIPSSTADMIIHYNSRAYSGQFSEDGNFYFSCTQDMRVHMYDTSNPYDWKYYKTVIHPDGQWTITDATLSPDTRFLAYSTIKSIVCLAPTDPNVTGDPWILNFSDLSGRRRAGSGLAMHRHFGIWSLRFSGDGREIVAGTSDHSVYVYDIATGQSILRIPGHNDDVNAVCFGDQGSPHILYSGSDDTLIKVWDRRSLGDSREAGAFVGHTEGLTYVDSKGDGRYVLSNGKDQTMKLWDLRKMMSTEKASKLDPEKWRNGFDYRFMSYSEEDYQPHPDDCSLVTFRGHSVLKTLIRCHFSPSGSTDSRYVYSGSECGAVHIYNLDATLAGKIDVYRATRYTRPRYNDVFVNEWAYEDDRHVHGDWKTCVRDVSWHPRVPMIAATSWNGYKMSTGTCTTHSWNDGAEDDEGSPAIGFRVNQKLEHDDRLYDDTTSNGRGRNASRRSRLRSRHVMGGGGGGGEALW